MNKNSKILILGGSGLVGSSLIRRLKSFKYNNLIHPTRNELNLRNQSDTIDFFLKNKPEIVIDAAAKVGGIHANNTFRGDFILENLTIQNNVFEASIKSDVDKLLYLGSSCIYPKKCPQPIKEEYLLSSELEPTNEPYAVSKIAGLKTAENLRRQYGKKFFSVMPTNLFGQNDNFHPQNSHVIPALINRMDETIKSGKGIFEVWGTGNPMREFLYVDDMADACIFLLEKSEQVELPYWINVGSGKDITIKELAQTIADVMNFKGELYFNTNYPDGTPRKLLDTTKINELGWKPKITFREGIEKTVHHFYNDTNLRRY